jgi:uncharacterized membrane protein SpoIIM required for sporulation
MTASDAPTRAPAPRLRSAEFRKKREAAWARLEELVTRAEKRGIGKLTTEELAQMPLLYRTASSSLSVARAIALDRNLVRYLENLVLRAYFLVYGPRTRMLEGFGSFLRRGFPQAVRANAVPLLISFMSILVGVFLGYVLVDRNEALFYMFTPADLSGGRGPESTAAELRNEEIFAPWSGPLQSFVVFANALFRHNATISLMAFGLGVFAGAPTLLLLCYQGLTFGAFLALHQHRGLLVDFLGWVSIHGVTEFGAIVLAGAGGLAIAGDILFPGRHGRLDNLARHGKTAAKLGGGAVLMLFVAGTIEGGLRELVNDTPMRFVFALTTAVLWLSYFLLAGRDDAAGN